MAGSSQNAWASVEWTPVRVQANVVGWQKKSVPYVPEAVSLQTMDIWIPAAESDDESAPQQSALPGMPGRWLVYIHGGAWRDPLVDSSSFATTAEKLLQQAAAGGVSFAGLASLNYRLSPHPSHPSHPAPPSDPAAPLDPARAAHHPDHIADVLKGLEFLQCVSGSSDYVLSGHSCGATLAFQAIMDPARWGQTTTAKKPTAVIGLNGLYDLAGFLKEPPKSHAQLLPVYDAFTRGAFGDDESVWKAVCPLSIYNWTKEWPEGKLIVLVQSREDTLVPYEQLELMRANLESSKGDGLKVVEMSASHDHNDLWKMGGRLAEIFVSTLAELDGVGLCS
jgi:acetyl esterase/lipase